MMAYTMRDMKHEIPFVSCVVAY